MYVNTWYQRRLDAGLCPYCGDRPPEKGYKSCKTCRKTKNEQTKARDRMIRKTVLSWICESSEPFCKRCGCTDIKALEINHINLNKNREIGGNVLSKRIFHGYRGYDDLEVLCAVCNTAHYKELTTDSRWEIKYIGN